MKLAFFGGGDFCDNESLDRKLLEPLLDKDPLFTFIPSSNYLSDEEFNELVGHYQKLGIKRFLKFDLDSHYSDIFKRSIFKSDIIHLGGGNTFYFLKYLKKNNFISELKQWVKDGGILTGLSAGGILMTNNINTASFPSFDRDDNEEKIKNFKAMNLVDFEFFPHYRNSKRYDQELLEYSKSAEFPVYACADGAGIIVDEDEMRFIGKTACFYQGTKSFIKK